MRSPPPRPLHPDPCTIVVEKLTKNIQWAHVHEIFQTYGTISSLEMPMNTQFKTNRGTARIKYTSQSSADTAFASMHDAEIDGAQIAVYLIAPAARWSRTLDPRRPPPARFGETRRGAAAAPRRGRGGGRAGSPGARRRSRSPRREEARRYRSRSAEGYRSPSRSRSRSPRRSVSGSPVQSWSARRSRTRSRSASWERR